MPWCRHQRSVGIGMFASWDVCAVVRFESASIGLIPPSLASGKRVGRTVDRAVVGVKRQMHVAFVLVENDGQLELGRQAERRFGARVRNFRQARGLTQEALAQWMTSAGYPMHQTTLAKIESGGRPTPVGEVAALAALFGVPVGEFFDTSDDVRDDMERVRLANLASQQQVELLFLDARRDELLKEIATTETERAELERKAQVRESAADEHEGE